MYIFSILISADDNVVVVSDVNKYSKQDDYKLDYAICI